MRRIDEIALLLLEGLEVALLRDLVRHVDALHRYCKGEDLTERMILSCAAGELREDLDRMADGKATPETVRHVLEWAEGKRVGRKRIVRAGEKWRVQAA